MIYVEKSPERPLGHVKHLWWRWEFQDPGSRGNKPHVHGGVTLHEGASEEELLQRICCRSTSFFHREYGTDFDGLLGRGLVSSWSEYCKLHELLQTVQMHDCDRARHRCKKKRNAAGELMCRVPRHPHGGQYWQEVCDPPYESDALERLRILGLAAFDPDEKILRPAACLRGGRWHYPASKREHFCPTVPLIFVALRSSTNIQRCDRRFQTAYLVKYAAGQEERKNVMMRAGHTSDEIHVESESLSNIKISGAQFVHREGMRQKRQPNLMAREIPVTEAVWYSLGLPYVHTNVEFHHVPSLPVECRPGTVRRASLMSRRGQPLDLQGDLPEPVRIRRDVLQLEEWRQFTCNQERLMVERLYSSYNLDQIAAFNLRPPELLIFNSLEQYHRYDFCGIHIHMRCMSCSE